MKYYGVSFEVKNNYIGSYWFVSGTLFKSENRAREHAEKFISEGSEPNETINYKLEEFEVFPF